MLAIFILAACGTEEDEQSKDDNDKKQTEKPNADADKPTQAAKVIHDVGESFEVEEELTGNPYEVTVKKIWTEDGDKHKKYLEDVDSKKDNANLTFITYSIKNLGDDPISLTGTVPNFQANGAVSGEVDISYPDNDFKKEDKNPQDLEVEPGDTKEITGVHDSTTYSENTGAFSWEISKRDDQPIVLQTPYKDRKNSPDVYKQGEPIQVLDETKDRQLIATLDHIKLKEELKDEDDIEKALDDSSWIVSEMKIENKGKKDINIQEAFPDIVVEDKVRQTARIDAFKIEKDDHIIHETTEDDRAILSSGEEISGTLYTNVPNKYAKKAKLYYIDPAFLTKPFLAQKVDYNLDK